MKLFVINSNLICNFYPLLIDLLQNRIMKTLRLILITILTLTTGSICAQTLEDFQKKGETLMSQGKNEEALEFFKKAIAVDVTNNENASLYAYAGLTTKYLNNDAEAKAYFQIAIERGFLEPSIYSMLGEICKTQNDIDCQENTYRKAMEIFPAEQQEFGKKLAYVYYNTKAYEKLELLASELLREEPEDEKLLQFYASSLQKNKKINEAKAVYEKLLLKNPNNLAANVFMGNYYYQVGKSKIEKEEQKYKATPNQDRVMWSNLQKRTKLITDQYYSKAVFYLENAYKHDENINIKKMLYAAYFKLGDKKNSELYKID